MMHKIIIITLLIYAIHYAFQPGEILGKIGNWIEFNMPDWFYDPAVGCNVCMSPWHGTWLYWVLFGSSWIEWLIVVFAAMGANAIVNKLSPDK